MQLVAHRWHLGVTSTGEISLMVTEMKTSRVRRTWLDKLLLWPRAYETRIFDGRHEVVGRGPTAEASQAVAEQRWVVELPTEGN